MRVFTLEKIAKLLPELRESVHRERWPIPRFKYHAGDLRGAETPDYDDRDWADFALGGAWGGYDRIAWFRARVPLPARREGHKLALRFLVGPRDGGASTAETMLYLNGEMLQGIDVWHEEAWLPPEHLAGEEIVVALRAWSGVLGVPERRRFKVAELVRIDEACERFYHLSDTLHKALLELDEHDWRHVRVRKALNAAFNAIDFTRPGSDGHYRSVAAALARLEAELASWRGLERGKPQVVGVGHAHIDLAWLWRLGHARDKAARTFATALHLMRQYPEYRFLHSSPQLYRFLEADHPELFARVKAHIKAGRWEATGGMWLEPDVNLPSGESLVRQLLFGQRYLQETFGRRAELLWLPDVFGYSWALPQLLRSAGITSFMTTKISWSQVNRFPHDTFRWRGIDGSEILTHFITTPEPGSPFQTYNGQLDPQGVLGLWTHYREKELNDELLTAFGWGDGGGGPTKEMLESARALADLPGFPTVTLGLAEPYFRRLHARLEGEELPVWDGELYLEYHRGTYTSQAQVKRDNRLSERLYHQAEWLSALSALLAGAPYPELRTGWERLLLNQFHDVLPGSSIREVYEDSAQDFAFIRELGEKAVAAATASLAEGLRLAEDGLLLTNALPWPRRGLVVLPLSDAFEECGLAGEGGALPSQRVLVGGAPHLLLQTPEVPAYGYLAAPLRRREGGEDAALSVAPERLESPFYRLALNGRGQLTSLYDKRHGREVLAPGERGNVLQAFEDKPLAFDAWDIDLFYQEKMREVSGLAAAEVEEDGPLRGVLRLVWRFCGSTITQRLTLYRDDPRIDFVTEIDWQERQVLLKAAFPVAVRATAASYDIQFGAIERPTHWNTSWDWARFEVVGHKWADLSQADYGVALLNDCKYGYDVRENVMRLTLLKSAVRPDAEADRGRHRFTYALLPHAGGWREGGVIPQAYALNTPLGAARVPAGSLGSLPLAFSLIEADSDAVVVETVKRAEDGDGWIVRLFEAKGGSARCALRFGLPLSRAGTCTILEDPLAEVPVEGDRLTLELRPFEVRTLRLHVAA